MKKQLTHSRETIKGKTIFLTGLFFSFFVILQIISCSKVTQEDLYKSLFNPVEKTPVNPLTIIPEESTKFGVVEYLTKMVNGSLLIVLRENKPIKGQDDEQIILSIEGNNDYIYYDNGSETIHLWWDRKITGTIRIIINGKEFVIESSIQDLTWKYINGNEEALMQYSYILKKIAAIAADFNQSFFQPSKIYIMKAPVDPINLTLKELELSAISRSEDPACDGPTYQSETYYAWSQTGCCSSSDSEVNGLCSNSSCSICCQTTCSWTGLIGEYMGSCSSSGTACSD
jgi:hypothetical protein